MIKDNKKIFIFAVLSILVVVVFLKLIKVSSNNDDSKSDTTEVAANVSNNEGDTSENIINDEPDDDSITISFTGDILLADNLVSNFKVGGISTVLSPNVQDKLINSDITFVNQEFPFSNRGTAQADKEYTYRVSPSRVDIFSQMGIDIVSLANNHVLDYGQDALADTFSTLDNAQIDYVGAGTNLDNAKKLVIIPVKGKNIGFLSASRVIPDETWYAKNATNTTKESGGVFGTYDDSDLCKEIKIAKKKCDFVVVYVHWGVEKSTDVEDYQREMAKDYIDAGADLIVGTHPHILQGVEYYKGVPIVYSLGNFLFSNYSSRTTVLTATIDQDNNCKLSFLPCISETYYTKDLDISEYKDFYEYMTNVSYGVSFSSTGMISK